MVNDSGMVPGPTPIIKIEDSSSSDSSTPPKPGRRIPAEDGCTSLEGQAHMGRTATSNTT